MKKYINRIVSAHKVILPLLFIAIGSLHAQTNTFPSSGNVGIGTTSPQQILDIAYPLSYGEVSTVLARLAEGNGTGVGTGLITKGYATQPVSGESYPFIKSFAIEHCFFGYINNSINFYRGGGYIGGAIAFNTDNNSEKMRIISNGNVGIGTTTPTEKLSVNGKIRAHEVVLETTSWPDYVFEKSYHPLSLDSIERFILVNKHLPNMPSAKEVLHNGQNIGEINAKLLQKMEELTLHLIEKDKQVSAQQRLLKNQQQQLNRQHLALQKLQKQVAKL